MQLKIKKLHPNAIMPTFGTEAAASTKFKSQTVLLLSGTLFFLLRLRSAVDECVAGRLPENIRTTARKYGKSCWGPKNRLCRQFP